MSQRSIALTITAAALSAAALSGCTAGEPGQSADASSAAPTTSLPPGAPTPDTSRPSPAESSAPVGEKAVITIKNFQFSGPASVTPGATVTVVNQDNQKHTVSGKGDMPFEAVVDGGGGNATFKAPTKPGSYPYFCMFHGNMTGVLVVR